jgi:hypothetical protein
MKRAEERGEMRASQLMPIALLGMVSICCLSLGGCSVGEAAEQSVRPDMVAVVEMASFGDLDRPSVYFPHDSHTEAMKKRNEDCTICHQLQDDGRLSSKYQRLEDTGEEELMDLYHDECIGCHQERAMADEATGPVACGACHRRRPASPSARQPFGLDKSLHYRHVKASNEKCEGCHHLYDDAKKELVYVEGKEDSCRDCHRQETEENRSAFRLAAHDACIGCHRDPSPEIQADSPGPQECSGCHDRQRQLEIKIVESPPRLKRNQPDFVLLSTAEADLESSKLKTVPFSHLEHEELTADCRTCHHEKLEPCSECHTLAGADKGDGVKLYRAMHGMTAESSCVGCHETKKAAAECAGCHALMEQERLSEHACDICHAGPLPAKLESEASQYSSMDDFRPKWSDIRLSFVTDDVPEEVKVGIFSEEYEPAVMPHRKIVNKLRQYINDSGMATQFHGHEDVVCQGCHHQSPVGEKPPLCESCHGTEAAESDLLKPGLLGAFHQQCLGCHERMELKEPSDCYGCHPAKQATVAAVTSSAVR